MEERKLFTNIFKLMSIGLLITFITAYYVSTQDNIIYNIFDNGLYWWIIFAEIILVIALSAGIRKLNYITAITMFGVYSFLTGLTFSLIFIVYELSSIAIIFGVAAFLFALFAFLGDYLKADLTKYRTYIFVALIGIILVSVINLFLSNSLLDIIISIVAILVFLGITMYDIQKIKLLSRSNLDQKKVVIIGALDLYLDFVNIFINLLTLFGKEK
ncbi:MAG: Bax inhibitor-1/YccA family protein [Bacilli bacterium]|nr:Bax inhibitor-1/YccA family protein [Bacilli bacterium]MDD4733279.1 Bax inhibitor-1/YccA family protein [Bacilli bacterium]